ncbi:uncharacterized protein LOC143378523 [Andrena cerasifolii]|uniref:uncharacterized protein LOC143378523 n=1 Tax=Andrena cerasifolii TaxID=2819439 RepID=UPI00403804B3
MRKIKFFYFWLKAVHNNDVRINHTEVGESITNIDSEPIKELFCDRSTVIIENNNLHNNIRIPDNFEFSVHEDGTLEENSNLTIADSLQALNAICDENMDPNNNLETSSDLIENIQPNLASQESIPTAENPASNKKSLQEESTKKKDSRIPSPFKRCVYRPQQKITENKRKRMDKIPAVATSEEWRDYRQNIVQRKQEAEAEKERRKIERLQKLKIKKEKDEKKIEEKFKQNHTKKC